MRRAGSGSTPVAFRVAAAGAALLCALFAVLIARSWNRLSATNAEITKLEQGDKAVCGPGAKPGKAPPVRKEAP